MPDASCPFCQLVEAGEYGYSDHHAVAFEPLHPVTPGHLLVVPRCHAVSALAHPLAASQAMHFAATLAGLMELDGCNFITSAGAAAMQAVMHLHIHVVPRHEGDGLTLSWTGQAKTPEPGSAILAQRPLSGQLRYLAGQLASGVSPGAVAAALEAIAAGCETTPGS